MTRRARRPRRPGPPRVVLATRIFTPEAAAATFRLVATVRGLLHAGAEVEVLTAAPPPGRHAGDDALPGARVRRWPVLRDGAGYVRGYLPYLSFDVPLAWRLLTVRRPDVVLVEPPPTTGAVVRAVLALRGVRRPPVPYVYYAADVWSDASASTGAPRPVVAALRLVERVALTGAAAVIAVSEGVAERARALGAGTVHVVPNGIDTGVFTPAGPRAAQAPAGRYLVYAGTASEWQGAEVFAEAMREVVRQEPDARLVFLGQGSSWPALQRVAAELPTGAIELRPLVPAAEAAAWQRGAVAALVSVRPGLGYDFAYPTKVVAALACGTAVVYAGPGPAVQDLREHRLGEAVAHEPGPVAQAMLRALRADPAGECRDRERRVAWVAEHRSLARTGAEAAAVVTAVAAGRPMPAS